MTTKEYAIQCIKDEAQALLDLIPHIDKDFEKAVELEQDKQTQAYLKNIISEQIWLWRRNRTWRNQE